MQQYQYSPVVKLSSFGKGKDSDIANARYIARFGTLQDEMGNPISQKQRAKAVEERLKQVQNQNKSSFRVIVSLPAENTDKAMQEVLDEIRNRYSSFLVAYHETNDAGQMQPHLHFLIFNDCKNHKLKDMNEIFNLRNAIGERFKNSNISFSLSQEDMKPKYKQAEVHMKEKGQQLWKDDIRQAVNFSLVNARDFDSFVSALAKQGVSIARETPNSLTFSIQEQGKEKRVRLDKLFTRMKNRQDIERKLAKKHKEDRMNAKMEELLKAERSFTTSVTAHVEELLKHGVSESVVQSRIEKILQHKTESEDIGERWNALKTMRDAMKEERQRWYEEKQKIRTAQYEQQRAERDQEYKDRQVQRSMQQILNSGNPLVALAVALVFLIAEMKKQQQHEKEKQHVHDILNPPSMLKTPDPDRRPGQGK
jgi:hypothetical protein